PPRAPQKEKREKDAAAPAGEVLFRVRGEADDATGDASALLAALEAGLREEAGVISVTVTGAAVGLQGAILEVPMDVKVRGSVEFTPRPEFTLNEGDSPSLVYLRVRDRVHGARRAELLRRNIACPEDLGLILNPAEEHMREAIAVADLADRLLGALLETGLR